MAIIHTCISFSVYLGRGPVNGGNVRTWPSLFTGTLSHESNKQISAESFDIPNLSTSETSCISLDM